MTEQEIAERLNIRSGAVIPSSSELIHSIRLLINEAVAAPQRRLADVQNLINGLEVGMIFEHDNDMVSPAAPLTELGLFVNRVEQIVQGTEET